jgi:ribosomal protein S18 acetylase RimI-like enzyme
MGTNTMEHEIVAFDNGTHRDQVVSLWERVFGYKAPHNAPPLIIDKKLAVADGLFFVAVSGGVVVGTIMAGYDGHRGWIYSMAVDPDHRMQSIGSRLLSFVERHLASRGCLKINLQIIEGNDEVRAFYEANGYSVEKRVSMGKRLPENLPDTQPGSPADPV